MRVRRAFVRRTGASAATAVLAVSATVAAGLAVPSSAAAAPVSARSAAALVQGSGRHAAAVMSGPLSSLAQAEGSASPGAPVELPALRTATSDTYDLGNGQYRTVVSTGPVNYLAQGGWTPIDDTLVPAAGGWTERANAYQVSLPSTGDGVVRVAAGGLWVSYQLLGAAAVPGQVSGASVSYPDVLPGVTVVYTATPAGVKESLLLASATAAASATFTETSSAGVSLTPTAGGGLAVTTAGGSRVFTLPPVTVSDAAGALTTGTLTAGVGTGGVTTVTAAVAPSWLAASGRVFPVDVDPSTVLPVAGPGDCALYNGLSSRCSDPTLAAGLNAGSWHARSIVYFDTSAIQQDDTVLGADLTLTATGSTVGTSGKVATLSMDAHALTRAYTSSASWADYDGTNPWTTAGGDFSATVQASATVTGHVTGPTAVDFTPTALVAGWVSGKTVNDGLIVVPQNESGLASNDGYVTFASTDASSGAPTLSVTYIPKVGDAASYTSIKRTIDDRATVKVNVGSGNLYVANPDVTIANPGVNLTVSRYYSSRSPLHPSLSLGWGLSGIDTQLLLNADGSVTSVDDTGRQTLYATSGSAWTTPPGGNDYLTHPDSSHYVLTANGGGDKRTFTVTTDGTAAQLTSDVDRNGNGVTWTRTGSHTTAITSTADATHTLSVSYDGSGRVHQIGDWTGRTWTYDYDPTSGALATYTDPNSKATSYSYNTNEILTGITTPRGNQTVIGYTPTHNMAASVQQIVSGTSGPTTTFTYNGFTGALATTGVKDPNSHTTTYTYDVSDRVTHTADALGHTRDTSWTANDDQATLTDGLSAVTTLSHDTLNNPTKSQAPNTSGGVTGRSASLGYPTPSGGLPYPQADYQPTSSTDAQNKTTNYSYTTTGNLATLTPPTGTGGTAVTNAYQGDSGVPSCGGLTGQLCSSTDGNGHKTTYGYNSTGQLTSVTPPAPLGATTTAYDTAGRPNAITDGKSQTTRRTYDGDDRITELQFGGTTTCTTSDISAGQCITYTYDGDGNLTGRADATGSTIWGYDTLNRITSKTIPGAATPSSVGYDAAGNVTSYTDAGGTVAYTYDPANQLWALAEPGGSCPAYSTTPVPVPNSTRCTGFTVDSNSHRTGINYPSGEKIALGYDTSGRETSITAKRPSATTFFTRTINYQTSAPADTSLVQQTVDTPGGTTTNTYDQLSRLTTAAVGSTTYGYNYDPAGNRTSSTVTGSATTYYGYNPADELCWSGTTSGSNPTGVCPASGPGTDTPYSYDADGNQTGSGLTFTYNSANQTTGITNAGTLTSFGYADAGQAERTTSTTGGTATTLLNGLVGVAAQTVGAGTTSYFTRDPNGNLISLRVGAGGTSTNSYYLLDQQASVLRLTDNTGNTDTATYTYDPYGRTLTTSGTQATLNPYRYATAYNDSTTGLYKLGVRYYNPGLGRFAQQDPKHQGHSYYGYAGGSPSNATDPTGASLNFSISGCLLVCVSASVNVGDNGVGVSGDVGAGPDAGVDASVTETSSPDIESGGSVGVDCTAGGLEGGVEASAGGATESGGVTTSTEVGCEADAGYSSGPIG